MENNKKAHLLTGTEQSKTSQTDGRTRLTHSDTSYDAILTRHEPLSPSCKNMRINLGASSNQDHAARSVARHVLTESQPTRTLHGTRAQRICCCAMYAPDWANISSPYANGNAGVGTAQYTCVDGSQRYAGGIRPCKGTSIRLCTNMSASCAPRLAPLPEHSESLLPGRTINTRLMDGSAQHLHPNSERFAPLRPYRTAQQLCSCGVPWPH